MSKQAKRMVVEVPVTDPQKREQLVMDRCTFATLVLIVARGGIDDFLKGCDAEARKDYGRIWDEQKFVPVGFIFQRPDFECKTIKTKENEGFRFTKTYGSC